METGKPHFKLLQQLLLRRKMPHQKHESYTFVLPHKNWINNQVRKNITSSKLYIFRKRARKLQNMQVHAFHDHNLIKQKPVEINGWLSPIKNPEMLIILMCMFSLFILGYVKKCKIIFPNLQNLQKNKKMQNKYDIKLTMQQLFRINYSNSC